MSNLMGINCPGAVWSKKCQRNSLYFERTRKSVLFSMNGSIVEYSLGFQVVRRHWVHKSMDGCNFEIEMHMTIRTTSSQELVKIIRFTILLARLTGKMELCSTFNVRQPAWLAWPEVTEHTMNWRRLFFDVKNSSQSWYGTKMICRRIQNTNKGSEYNK